MRIIQLLPTLVRGDAVGNDAITMHCILQQAGYETKIYAENYETGIDRDIVDSYRFLPKMEAEDWIIYHFSIGSDTMAALLREMPCRKAMVYHNITPESYFLAYDPEFSKLLRHGREELLAMRDYFRFVIADSSYNKQELQKIGYDCPVAVLPILVPFDDYRRNAAVEILQQYDDHRTNLLYVGRMAPNKKIEDVISAYAQYKKTYDAQSRLFLVGNESALPSYRERLRRYVQKLGLSLVKDVIFSGHVPFEHILAYYRLADVYVCMSEHEGFCVPLAEAMSFDVPIVALDAAAVAETLGDAGLLLPNADSCLAAAVIHAAVTDDGLRAQMQEGGRRRLKDFSYETVRRKFLRIVEQLSTGKFTVEQPHKTPYGLSIQVEKIIASAANTKSDSLAGFETIPLTEDNKRAEATSLSWKWHVKHKFLKPGYYWLHRFAPALADSIGRGICRITGRSIGRFQEQVSHIEKSGAFLDRKSGLLIDVSSIACHDWGTGIQRVVNNVYQELVALKSESYAVQNGGGFLTTAYAYMGRWAGNDSRRLEQRVALQAGDILFLLDSSWEFFADFEHIIREAQKNSTKIYAVVYDLFPIQYPETAASPLFSEIFIAWHDMVLQKVDGIICISRTTADNVAAYYQKKRFTREKSFSLFYFPMGAEIECKQGLVRQEMKNFVQQKRTFLMVGTVEPRKGHRVVLDALATVAERHDVQLLVLGHDGWKNDEIKKDMETPAIRECVLWIQDAADHELHWAYQNTEALIAASKDEGYGLPLIEAAYFGLPILCSDIPIFHEVTQEHATYFRAMDAVSLAEVWERWLREETHPDSREIRLYTWRESAQAILDIFNEKTPAYKVLK